MVGGFPEYLVLGWCDVGLLCGGLAVGTSGLCFVCGVFWVTCCGFGITRWFLVF